MLYDLVYADPPWGQNKGGLRKSRPNQTRALDYPTLDLTGITEILALYPSKVLFMWTIDTYLHESEAILKRLGYKLHARIVWDKQNGVAPAFTIRFCHEYLLWGYTTPMLQIEKSQRGKLRSVISEPPKRHSQKPECAYQMIEALYPNATKIELFARNRRVGWDSWGNEC